LVIIQFHSKMQGSYNIKLLYFIEDSRSANFLLLSIFGKYISAPQRSTCLEASAISPRVYFLQGIWLVRINCTLQCPLPNDNIWIQVRRSMMPHFREMSTICFCKNLKFPDNHQQDRLCAYNVTLKRVRVTKIMHPVRGRWYPVTCLEELRRNKTSVRIYR
jgi:hypothetical protein